MNKSITVLPFPEIKNAYIVISGRETDTINKVTPSMSFLYGTEKIAVEWEPDYGPITILYSCAKDHPEAQEHWFFPFITGYGNWNQLAVNRERLGEKFYTGKYKELFEVLKNWHDNAN
jgi:hypothetical protein